MIPTLTSIGTGLFFGLVIKELVDRRAETRAARSVMYHDLITMLVGKKRVLGLAVFDHEKPMKDDKTDVELDALNARLRLDASNRVLELARECLKALGQFSASLVMQVPAQVTEGGIYEYRFDLVAGNGEGAKQQMRMALGKIYDDYVEALDALTEQTRRELHGRRS